MANVLYEKAAYCWTEGHKDEDGFSKQKVITD